MKLKWEEKDGKLSYLDQVFLICSDGFCNTEAPFRLACDPRSCLVSKTGPTLFQQEGLCNTGHVDKRTLSWEVNSSGWMA